MDHTHEVTGSNPVSPSLPAPSRPSRAGDCLKPTQASPSGSHATPTKKPRILDTFLRALETLAQLAPEVTALDEELAGREEEVLRRVLELVRPILPPADDALLQALRDDAPANRFHYPRSLWFAGGLIAFVLLNVEIADAYSTGRTIGIHMGASLGEDMTYSLGWGMFGIVTLIAGMRFRSPKARMCALAVLLLTIGKVFLHDLWHLGALYRVGSMVGLAVALLLVSFLTQRFILRGDRT